MRSEYTEKPAFEQLLGALMPANRRALRLSLYTGLRIGDCLNLHTAALAQRMTVRELKTGKNRKIRIPKELLEELRANAGKWFVFEHRYTAAKHRTRAAVFKDLRRCATIFRINGKKLKAHISPHSARKIFAVGEFRRYGDLRRVQALLNHSDEAVTMLYAMADELTARNHR